MARVVDLLFDSKPTVPAPHVAVLMLHPNLDLLQDCPSLHSDTTKCLTCMGFGCSHARAPQLVLTGYARERRGLTLPSVATFTSSSKAWSPAGEPGSSYSPSAHPPGGISIQATWLLPFN